MNIEFWDAEALHRKTEQIAEALLEALKRNRQGSAAYRARLASIVAKLAAASASGRLDVELTEPEYGCFRL